MKTEAIEGNSAKGYIHSAERMPNPEFFILGARCLRLIRCNPEGWGDAVAWLTGISPFPEAVDDKFGPICRTLVVAFYELSHRFTGGCCSEDRFADVTSADARRAVLLGALIFNADFDGNELGLNWPYASETEDGVSDGRSWARSMLLSQPGHEHVLHEILEAAVGYIEILNGCSSEFDGRSPASVSSAQLTQLNEGRAPAREFPEVSHSEDFTSVNWFGNRYQFSKGNQAQTVRVLWEAWEKGGHSLSQETIGEQIGSSASNFDLKKTFRIRQGKLHVTHPAWGTMIQPSGKGTYRLVPPNQMPDPTRIRK